MANRSCFLPANVEGITLTGLHNLSATGNGLDNVLTGNAANNRLDGGADKSRPLPLANTRRMATRRNGYSFRQIEQMRRAA